MKSYAINIVLMFVLLTVTSTVYAEAAKRSGGSDAAAARAQMMLRQITAERDAFRAEAEKMEAEVEKRDKKIETLKRKVASIEKRVGHSGDVIDKYKENSEMMRDRILDARDKMQKLVDKYRELVTALKIVEGERAELVKTVDEKQQLNQQCAGDNVKLYETNLELIDLYKDKSAWDAFVQAEPFTQLKRVEIENIAQQYRIKVNDLSFVDMEK